MKNTMRQLVSFNLDMTLLDYATYATPDSALEVLKRLRERGLVAVLATGRDMDNYYSRRFRGMIGADAVIHMNGTKITVGDKLIYEHYMGKKLLEWTLDFAKTQGYSVGVTIGDEDLYAHSEQVAAHGIRHWGECGGQFKGPMKLLNVGMRTLAYVGASKGAHRVEEAFPGPKFLLLAGFQGADVVEKAASKTQGLLRLCDYHGTDVKDTYTFDNSTNNYEIVQITGAGIVMGNALDVLKEVADYMTVGIREDGMCKVCAHLEPIQYGEERTLIWQSDMVASSSVPDRADTRRP